MKKQELRFLLVTCFLLISLVAFSQRTITGTIYDKDTNEPLIGANVLIKGLLSGTTTDIDGTFSLEVPDGSDVLEISYTGYASQELALNNATNYTVYLAAGTQLDEVVVIGYGVQRRESVTGSVVSLKGQELTQVQTSNFQDALQGRVAGVDISTTNTRPGAAPQVRIRGVRSLSANNDPLIVLNGIPFSGGLNDINPNDIESVDILKDASATAIYGSRGANGVILITTKTGKKGQKPVITYDAYLSTKEVFAKYPMMNAAQTIQLRADVAANNGGVPIYGLGGDEDLGNDTDWQDLLYGSGLQNSHDLSIRGGGEKNAYNLGLGYYRETSVVPGDAFKRYSLRAQVDQEIGDFIRVGLNSVTNFNNTSSIAGLNIDVSPLLSPYDENGNFLESVRLQTEADNLWVPTRNEIERIGEGRVNEQLDFGTYNNLYAEVKAPWIEGLKYRLSVGLNFRNSRDGNFTGRGVFSFNPDNPSSASYNSSITKDHVIEHQLIFDRTIAQKHRVNVIGLYSAQRTEFDNIGLGVQNVPNELALWYNLDAALSEDITSYGTGFSVSGLISYMGRIMYEFDNRYLFTATLRSDGSSRLAEGNKWFTFPAVSVGWNIGNEAFMESVDWINALKIRAGYGETANQAVAPYSTQGRLNQVNYNFGSDFSTGYSVNQLPNPSLGWEFSETYNFGLEFSLFNYRLSGTLELYSTETNDILYGLALPSSSGVSSVTSNIGKTSNKGFELSLDGIIIDNPNGFSWDLGINLFRNTNEILSLATGEDRNVGQLWFVGSPINVIYDYENIGLWNESDPDFANLQAFEPGGNVGMIKVSYTGDFDENGVPVRAIGADDRVIIDPTPDFQGGFNTRLAYKNFDLTMVGSFRSGGILVSTLYSSNGYLNLLTGRRNNVDVDYWTPTNTDAKYPAPGGIQSGDNQKYASTLGYFNGSYLKVRALTLGYNFTPNILSKIKLNNLRIYGTILNPFVLFSPFHDESGLDPEVTNSGVDAQGQRQNSAVNTSNISRGIPTIGTNVPSTRTFLIGLNVSF